MRWFSYLRAERRLEATPELLEAPRRRRSAAVQRRGEEKERESDLGEANRTIEKFCCVAVV
uniref:Uncharacterized protein n=1 Tax=Oryza brachyantha TaxID=4533 RepID=J3LIG8_ORYBR